ncbi:FYVE, RhoGEF and PH domain-containing protein 2 [Grifola frondosa]|uniref:FYVE, RhoGEF and PH domain-containing protein 2 n=1 Tax=Grifola frondosa TaxID=5627 RepID=A0A1C7MQ10_GRIFR|nr:FYVE, RhoGEF and PH domain-containing protein 2 [Grifola frondosa]
MRPDPPPQSKQPIAHSRPQQTAPYPRGGTPKTLPAVPSIDVRISTTGSLLQYQGHSPPREMVPPSLSRKSSNLNISTVHEAPKMLSVSSPNLLAPAPTSRANKRRSFLPIDMSPIPIPSAAPFLPGVTATNSIDEGDDVMVMTPSPVLHVETCEQIQRREEERAREARVRALRSVMAYLKDMYDLGLSQTQTMSMYGNLPGTTPETSGSGTRSRRPTVVDGGRLGSESSVASIASMSSLRPESSVHLRSPEVRVGLRSGSATQTNSVATTDSGGSGGGEERKYKDDKGKRARVIREIVETERTYVKVNVLSGVGQSKDTVVPAQERKIVFSGLEALFSFHKESFLPALERASAPLLSPKEGSKGDVDGHLSSDVARDVANTFVSHAAFMKMYSTYINNFDNSVQRIRTWVSDRSGPSSGGQTLSPSSSSAQLVGLGLTMAAGIASTTSPDGPSAHNVAPLSSSQKKRIRAYIKRCRMNPRHSQLNLEGYLLLPVQRIPRYRLLLEELVRSSPPMYEYMEDPIDRALTEIAELATNMNEGKRESESRRKLVLWQSRIRGKFPSPLVQPHRRLIMDGPLQLTRVVRKATVSFEVIDSSGDASSVQVECLSPELTPRSLIGILCNDLLVLCRDPSEGKDPNSFVDLWAVLRMQTLPQPASIVHGNALRLVDNKAILYFDAPSTSDALTWFRAINLHIPASKA